MTGLVVPVDVVAYCVGSTDAHECTGAFAGATTSYTAQATDANPAFLGMNVARDPHGFPPVPPLWPLEEGVHLHWAAPDGLTHAPRGASGLDFPALPNRWLVTRVLISGSAATGKSWILESDTLSATRPGANNIPTLPVQDTKQNFRYLGVWEVFDGSWQEPVIPPAQKIRALFGSDLHAVASGDVAFAAFYPNARGVYGFHDDVSDIQIVGSQAVNLMYVVTGWYADPTCDPLTTYSTPADLQSHYGWTYSPVGAEPAYSLYSGVAQDIQWNPTNLPAPYIKDKQPAIHVDVAIGSNPAEALAAYFRGTNHPTLPLFEQLFTAFEIGLLSKLQQPAPGQYAELQEAVHEKGFTNVDGGTIYTIVSAAANGVSDDPSPNLPLALADALNLLNEFQQQSDLAALEVEQYQWQLFADWYRLVRVDPGSENEASNTLSERLALWPAIQSNRTTAQQAVIDQLALVNPMLGKSWVLKQVPAPRFWLPNELVVLLAGAGATPSPRHGGDGRYGPDGNLVCRLTTELLSDATVSSAHLSATGFPQALPPTPNHLSHAADVAALVGEACVLNTSLAAALSGLTDDALKAALSSCLVAGSPPHGNPYASFTGLLPSPVQMNWWGPSNPWLPLMMLWEVDFAPLFSTAANGSAVAYSPEFFTANFTLDPDNVGVIGYTPTAGTGGIDIDPGTIDFNPVNGRAARYTGSSVLSTTSVDNLAALLTEYLKTNQDATLQAVQTTLEQADLVLQPVSGLASALLTRQQSLQLNIGAGSQAPFGLRNQTNEVKAIIPDLSQIPAVSPVFEGSFNPVRAGFAKLQLQLLDTFGERRPVTIDKLYLANDLATSYRKNIEPGIIYLQPRLSQAARVLFRWLAADTLAYDEMNAHPATSPICGWLVPNHLEQGIFFYDQLGAPLGSLTVKEDLSGIEWQAAPGIGATIDEGVTAVMQDVNAQLGDVAKMLAAASVEFFQAFWTALDTAASSVAPPADSGAGTVVLLGRPVALVQASLLLELQGITAYDETWNTLVKGDRFAATDDGTTGVGFPAVIGDIDQLDDGLVGYFKLKSGGGYDLSKFFSEAADLDATSGVVRPKVTNLLLSPSATVEGQPPSVTGGEQKVLMLMDPRAGIHLTTGILPTQYIEIPPAQYADTLSDLEATFLTAPVLRPAADMALPLGTEPGFTWSWIEEQQAVGAHHWAPPIPNIGPALSDAVWQYTPQQLTEGWLRLSPELLAFTLRNPSGGASVQPGVPNTLTLTITNRRRSTVTFTPGTLVVEGSPLTGSVLYIHFGSLVAPSQVASIQPSATGWQFKALQDTQYGAYWATTPTAAVTLEAGKSITMTLANLLAASGGSQAQLYFEYYAVQGLNDGVDVAIVAVAASVASSSR